jgi:biotin operon repressor
MSEKQILMNLYEKMGELVPGDQLASELQISPDELQDQIQSLKEDGYNIESSPEGYRLVEAPKRLLPYEIQRNLETSYITSKRWTPPTKLPRNWPGKVPRKEPLSLPKVSAVVKVGGVKNGYHPLEGCG